MDTGYVSGYALCTVEITGLKEYPYELDDGRMLYGWKVENIEFIEPFPVKGKLHLFEVDDSLIKPHKRLSVQGYIKKYYDPLRG